MSQRQFAEAICYRCGFQRKTPAGLHGHKGRCPQCGEVVDILLEHPRDRRRSARYACKDCYAYLGPIIGSVPLVDVSEGGVAMDGSASEYPFFAGKRLNITLEHGGETVVENLEGEVVGVGSKKVSVCYRLEAEEVRRIAKLGLETIIARDQYGDADNIRIVDLDTHKLKLREHDLF